MIGAARESGVLPSVNSPILPLARAFPQAPPAVAHPPAALASGLIAPPIDKVPAGIPRPLWSVMIPTFNCAAYLRETLASVLAQDPGPDRMQIEVVDDCSTKDDPEAVVHELGRGRVAFHRKPANAGAIANFNTCLARSRGHLVHLLHGDDCVQPGFYEGVGRAASEHPGTSAFFTRAHIVDETGALLSLTPRLAHLERQGSQPGNLWYSNGIRTPAVVIRRSFYEDHGGFLPALVHVADWEMWVRAIRRGEGFAIKQVLATYREFPGNDTGRLARTAENLRDYLRLGDLWENDTRDFDPVAFRRGVASAARQQAIRFEALGDQDAAAANRDLWRSTRVTTSLTRRLARSVLAFFRTLRADH